MEETETTKFLIWKTKDVIKTILIFFLNFIILASMFILTIFIKSNDGEMAVREYFSNTEKFIDFLILLALVITAMALYFGFEKRDFIKTTANVEMLFLILEVSLAVCLLAGRYLSIYIRPIALASILTLYLTNSRTGLFINMIFSLLLFLFDAFAENIGTTLMYSEVFFLTMGITSGVIATYCLKEEYSRLTHVLRSFIISIPIVLCLAIPIVSFGSDRNTLRSLIMGACSGPVSVLAFLVLLPIFEALFQKVSTFKLAELINHRARHIRRLIKEAPGTFNHSIIVSNIAEMCATAIGEDALLAKTCAYYHDIGKLRRPEFFKENQADGVNLHDDLTPELSANIIKSHAQDGYSLAVKNRLPKVIADVCREHHGTLPIWFFYDKAKKFTDGEVSISQYSYLGPKPQSKIAAIIMIADGCEAAARSLSDRSRENVKNEVKKIVSERMQLGQFDECEITLKELNIIIHTTVNSLTGVYHKRVEYPKVSLEGLDVDKKTETTDKESK